MYRTFFKRFFDVVISFCALVFLAPVLFLLTLILAAANRGSPFFIQERPGRQGKIFHVVKFKTMNDRRDDHGKLLPDKERLTSIGKFVRSASLDEFPQFWNILIGDMSLIGPRPLLVKYLPLYNETQARRHEVRPGLTGWAQVNGRNSISWEKRFSLDVFYVDHLSLALDCKIVLLTIKKILRREGINSAGAATMEPFTGTK